MLHNSRDKQVVGALYLALAGTALSIHALLTPAGDIMGKLFFLITCLAIVAFLFGFKFGNHTLYFPLWNGLPLIIVLFLIAAFGRQALTSKTVLAAVLTIAWSCRMSWHWWRRWKGLGHQDFRHAEMLQYWGRWFTLFSFLVVYVMPSVFMFLMNVPLYYIFLHATWQDAFTWAGLGLSVLGLLIEWLADEQLYRFQIKQNNPIAVMRYGLWRYLRHPNYLGEILFWAGLALASFSPLTPYWVFAGPLLLLFLIRSISIPMMRRHLLKNKPGYDIYLKSTWALIPRIPSRSK